MSDDESCEVCGRGRKWDPHGFSDIGFAGGRLNLTGDLALQNGSISMSGGMLNADFVSFYDPYSIGTQKTVQSQIGRIPFINLKMHRLGVIGDNCHPDIIAGLLQPPRRTSLACADHHFERWTIARRNLAFSHWSGRVRRGPAQRGLLPYFLRTDTYQTARQAA